MAEAAKVLGQVAPSATTLTTLYTVPGATSTVVSSLSVCNRGSTSTTLRISIQIAAAADDPKQYIYYDLVINGNDTFVATIGITLATTDVVKCYAGNANLSFSLFGIEVT